MAITSAFTDFASSVYELFASLVGAVYTIVHSFIAGTFSLFSGFFAFIADIFQGVFDIVGGVGKFVSANIVILGILGAGIYGYLYFTRQAQLQGQRTGAKKTN